MVDKIANAAAASMYANTAKVLPGTQSEAGGPSFMDMIKSSAIGAIQTVRGGEKASADAISGKASLPDVVDAITQAELTLQTVVAVRDRMISAYQEIMRMPI